MTGLAEALLAFQAEAPALQKDAVNPHFKNKYVSLDKLIEQVLPILNKHGLVLIQKPALHEQLGHPALLTKIVHAESGESEEALMPLAMAKNDPQGQGSAITYARRYALMAFLGLVADADDDGGAATKAKKKETEAASRADKMRARIVELCDEADTLRGTGGTLADVEEFYGGSLFRLSEDDLERCGSELKTYIASGCAVSFIDYANTPF